MDDSIEDEKSKVKKDALIYQQRDDNDNEQAYQELDSQGKWQFFKDYYLKTVLLVAALLLVGGFYLYRAMTKPQTILYIAVSDDVLDSKQVKKLEEAVGTYLSLNPKHEVVTINTTFNHRDVRLNEQLQSMIYAGKCDVVISSKEGFEDLAIAGYFFEPDTSETVKIFESQKKENRYYYPVIDGAQLRGEKEKDDTEYNFGISVKECAKYRALKGLDQEAIIGIPNSTRKPEEAAAFLKFLLDDSLKAGDVDPDFAPQ